MEINVEWWSTNGVPLEVYPSTHKQMQKNMFKFFLTFNLSK